MTKQRRIWEVGKHSALALRVGETQPHHCCAGVCPPASPRHCHSKVRCCEDSPDCCHHTAKGGPGAQTPNRKDLWEHDSTARPAEEEVG